MGQRRTRTNFFSRIFGRKLTWISADRKKPGLLKQTVNLRWFETPQLEGWQPTQTNSLLNKYSLDSFQMACVVDIENAHETI